jgi:hypothetical protein
MSFSFYIPAPQPPDYERIIDQLDSWDLHRHEDRIEDGPWPEGTVHFYRDEVSTRGVEITHENGVFQVRILTLASPEDYELALRFVEAAAAELGQDIEPEDHEAIPLAELRGRYDAAWVHQTNLHGAMVVRQLVQESDTSVMSLYGTRRPIYLGPRVIGELEEAGPEEEFLDRLIDMMRGVQNVNGEDYFFANVMEAQKQDSPDAEKFTFAVFGPTVSYLLPEARYVALIVEESEPPMFIEASRLPLVLPEDSWTWLDERQMLVEAIEEDAWREVVRKAKQFEVRPTEEE